MNRRSFLRKSLIGGAGVSLLAGLPLDSWAEEKGVKLTVLHTNDTHSRIEPFPEGSGKLSGLGGMAQRATLIKKIRAEEENVLLLDAGDIFQGTPYFNYFGGELEYKLMSEMGYDATTLGNHDFDNGLEGLKKQLPHARFDFLIANYDFSDTILKDNFKPYKIFNKGALKIGVFGLGIELDGLVPNVNYGKTLYLDPVLKAKGMVRKLKDEECDLIICLSHLGYAYEDNTISDLKLAAKVDGIDLIIGGHTHTFLDKPTVVKSPSGNKVLINQVGWSGINLGRIDFNFHRKSKSKVTRSEVVKVS
ncbi:metallophosphatase [Xanthovirga aplysinae]|uniref:bifunctional metallophosphatase/5'-nucleotidase n=1 Tax=Xanthovirga aplysinae TaxID=2529853 RepID=UPI001656F46A|nr:bifunctional metallophosphatase/5'-nucleotidase [Xanthovirga aplysinae]